MDIEQPSFTRKITPDGGSVKITIPKEVLDYLELEEGDEVEMIATKGKKGRYAAFWKKEVKK